MSQIDYTSRDFESLKLDLINLVNVRTGYDWVVDDPSDLGSVLLEAVAYMGDIMSYYIDRVANETSVETAVKRETLLKFAELYGYRPSGPIPAQVSVAFTNISTETLDLPIGTQVMAPLTYGPFTEVFFETTQAVVQLQPDQTITVTAREGKTVNTDRPDLINPATNKPLPVNLGTSSGLANQEFYIYEPGVVDNSLVVYVGQGVAFGSWRYVDSLADYGPNSLIFTTRIDEDGSTTVVFGDGVNGAIPPVNQLISALYKNSLGIAGNVIANAIKEVTFIPGNGNPEALSYLSVSNASAAIGGADADSLEQLRKGIKSAIISRKRAVTLEDYEKLAMQVSGVAKVKAVAGVYSSVTLYVQSPDDGSTTPGIYNGSTTTAWNTSAAAISAYLEDKIPVGTTVTVQNPTYVPIYLTVALTLADQYKHSAVKLAVSKALLNPGGLFHYDKNEFGRSIPKSSVIATIAGIEGVVSVDITKMNTDNGASSASITLAAGQIPYLLPANLVFPTPIGGIA
jgi:uncharacterized phage protein gp47/JayE